MSLVDKVIVDTMAMAKYLLIASVLYSLWRLGLTCMFLFAESVVTSQSRGPAEPSQPVVDELKQQPHSVVCYFEC